MGSSVQNILVVDDAPDIRALIDRALTRAGHAVTAVGDGAGALAAAQRTSFDVAVVDYDIPAPNGLDVLARLRRLQPNCVRILISGDLDVRITLDAVNRGEVSRLLRKPFDGNALISAVRESLEQRRRVAEEYITATTGNRADEELHLRQCFEQELLRLAIQPILNTSDRKVVAFEALLRSTHPVLNGPQPVLLAAESQGQLATLGATVVKRAAAWLDRLPDDIRLFINLHPLELADPEGLGSRLEVLSPVAARVVLEITERSKVMDVDAWETSTPLISNMGFSLAVDDLGAGYSSLSVPAQLKPQIIKIDMSIIRDVDSDRHKQRLVELLCRFGEATEAQVIAEGIETEAEAAAVAAVGVHLVQGYLFGKPSLDLPSLP